MDEALRRALLIALHTSISDKSLPLLVSSIWGQHLAPAAARLAAPIVGAGEDGLSVKATSWKKLATFLGDMQALGLVTVDEPRKGVQTLSRVNRNHELYTGFSVDDHVRGMHAMGLCHGAQGRTHARYCCRGGRDARRAGASEGQACMESADQGFQSHPDQAHQTVCDWRCLVRLGLD